MIFSHFGIIGCGDRLTAETRQFIAKMTGQSPMVVSDSSFRGGVVDEELYKSTALLVGTNVVLRAETLQKFTHLRSICVCGSSTACIDTELAEKQGISITSLRGYCDDDTADFAALAIAAIGRGMFGGTWHAAPVSLKGLQVGILGAGAVATGVAQRLNSFGCILRYYSNRRKPEMDRWARYADKHVLLERSRIITLHTSPHKQVLNKEDFDTLRSGAALLNTCAGELYHGGDLRFWLADRRNAAFFDAVAARYLPSDLNHENVHVIERQAFRTPSSIQHLNEKIMEWLHAAMRDLL